MTISNCLKSLRLENKDKGERFSVTVPRDYKNPSLYTWYRKQKIYAKHKMLPSDHERLLREEKFYFGDAHELWQEWKVDQKLALLQATSCIKHLAVSGLSSVSARIKSSCNLIGNRFEMPNVSYTQPLNIIAYNRLYPNKNE
jgi:hypothetical protein